MPCGLRGCCFIMVPLRQFLHLFFVTRALPRINGVSVCEFPCLCDCLNSLWFCCEVCSFLHNFSLGFIISLFFAFLCYECFFFFFWSNIFMHFSVSYPPSVASKVSI